MFRKFINIIRNTTTSSNEEIANNYIKALEEGEKDDFIETDMKYESFSPSLREYLQEYVEKNKDCIFD